MASGPTSNSFVSQRLKLHYVDWGNEDAPPLLLVHGGRDQREAEAEGVDLPRQVDVGGVPGAPAGNDRHVGEAVRAPPRLAHPDLDLGHVRHSSRGKARV